MSYEDDTIRPDARLIILKELVKQVDERLNSAALQRVLRDLGIDRPRHWVHSEIEWLAEVGAVTLTRADTIIVATLTEKKDLTDDLTKRIEAAIKDFQAQYAAGKTKPADSRTRETVPE